MTLLICEGSQGVVPQLQRSCMKQIIWIFFQLVFRPEYGKKMAWVRLLDYLWRGQDSGCGIVVSIFPFLDLLEAFNSTVSFWTDSEDWRCRAQYCPSSSPLQGWFQSVMIGEESSCPLSYYLRCPQGLVFSPVLFNIYMRALGEFIHCHGVKHLHLQYADATHLYIYTPGELRDAVDILYQG